MSERAQSALAYAILIFTSLAGVARFNWWAVCLGACALILLSLIGRQLRPASQPHQFIGGVSDLALALSSVINGSAAASAAFVLGKGSVWLWGF